jgi:hypothetical protein
MKEKTEYEKLLQDAMALKILSEGANSFREQIKAARLQTGVAIILILSFSIAHFAFAVGVPRELTYAILASSFIMMIVNAYKEAGELRPSLDELSIQWAYAREVLQSDYESLLAKEPVNNKDAEMILVVEDFVEASDKEMDMVTKFMFEEL